jgi:hypothetical protein
MGDKRGRSIEVFKTGALNHSATLASQSNQTLSTEFKRNTSATLLRSDTY